MRASWAGSAAAAAATVVALFGLPGWRAPSGTSRPLLDQPPGRRRRAPATRCSAAPRARTPFCAAARAGTASGSANNNNERRCSTWTSTTTPRRSTPARRRSTLPAGARIVQAALYYGGRDQAGTGGQPAPNPSARNRVLVKAPGSDAYVPVTAVLVDDAGSRGTRGACYAGVADVTALVKAAGAGEYTVANVQLGTGKNADQSGGWALEVFYEDPTQPSRNITVFDGFQFVTADQRGRRADHAQAGRVPHPAHRPGALAGGARRLRGRPRPHGRLGAPQREEADQLAEPAGQLLQQLAVHPHRHLHRQAAELPQPARVRRRLPRRRTATWATTRAPRRWSCRPSATATPPAAVSIATDLFAPTITPTKTVDKAIGAARRGAELRDRADELRARRRHQRCTLVRPDPGRHDVRAGQPGGDGRRRARRQDGPGGRRPGRVRRRPARRRLPARQRRHGRLRRPAGRGRRDGACASRSR